MFEGSARGHSAKRGIMGDIAIRVEGIGKKYRIGKKERYKTLRDTLVSTFAVPFQKAGKFLRGEGQDDC